jgi:hypothetical protein
VAVDPGVIQHQFGLKGIQEVVQVGLEEGEEGVVAALEGDVDVQRRGDATHGECLTMEERGGRKERDERREGRDERSEGPDARGKPRSCSGLGLAREG